MSKLEKISPLFTFVLMWDIFWPSRISHYAWWIVFPFVACIWFTRSRHILKRTAVIALIFGATLNGAVVMCNGGMMPVDRPERIKKTSGDKSHVPISSATRMKYLSDIFYTGFAVMSIGDIVIFSALTFWAIGAILQRRQAGVSA